MRVLWGRLFGRLETGDQIIFREAVLPLVKANLSEAQLSGTTFSGAQLDGVNFARVSAGRIDLGGARMRNAVLDGADLQGAKLEGADLLGASLINTNLHRANLARTLLDEARLIRTDLREANLTGASLRRARIVGVDVAGADVRGAILVGAEIDATANLDAAQNHASVLYDEPVAPRNVPNVRPPAAPWTARIYLHQGVPVEVESWSEQDTLVLYVKDGVTHGIPSSEIAKIVDRSGKILRDTPLVLKSCYRPRVGDAEAEVKLYFSCVGLTLHHRTSERQGRVQTVYSSDPGTRRSGVAPLLFYVGDGKVTEVVTGTLDPSQVEPTRPNP